MSGAVFGSAYVIAATVSDSHVLDITAIVPGAVVTPPGGGTNVNPVATVVLSGNSFPSAKLTLLKDGIVFTSLIANPDGTFQITINNLNFGNYQFSLYAEDPSGQVSSSYVVNVPAFSAQPYTYSGIILPPTATASALLIQTGKSFNVFGYSASNSTVEIQTTTGQILATGTADANGFYRVDITANLAPGLYTIRARAFLNGSISLPSKPIQVLFYRGDLPPGQIPPPPIQYANCVDYNKDHRVNLIDFSILLFWFGKNPPPPSIDCNGDHVIDIKDFSILMYFWTG